ncbi:MAG TPA: tetratricopeptide repeat protein [Thermoanaerobaculia bacterium]|nr:tetratricopeptide repeat protein [Thermoanaerobaculia bacterium]
MKRTEFFAACAAAIALILGAYAGSLDNSFHFDDSHVIENNLYLRSLEHVPRYFTDAYTFSSLPQNATYRPLVTLSLALDYARGALNPRPYHVTQIALLLITGALLVLFFTPIAGELPALLAATLFCVHTANTETMNLISARSELLSTVGLLGSLVLYQRSPFARRSLLYLIPLAIGALAKAPLVVFAPLLFAYALLIERKSPREALRIALPSLLLGIALLVFLNSMNAKEWESGGGSAWSYLITQPFVWLHYARLFVLPIGLTADSDWTTFAHWYDTRAVAGYAFIALLILAIRRAPATVAFGLTWFAVALLPTSIFPLAEVSNEHRIFFAFIGLVLIAATYIRTRTLAIAATLLLCIHAFATHQRNAIWKSEEALWADVVAKSPANGRAWMNYGLTLMSKGDYVGAKRNFEHAETLVPNYSTLEINLGIVKGELGDDVAAERHFRRALELRPDVSAHLFYARWLAKRGRAPEALPHAREAMRLSPASADARALTSRLEVAKGAAGSRTWPDYRSAFDAGLEAIRTSDWSGAVEANRAALAHDPRSADAWNNLGWSLAQLGFRDEAMRAYRKSLEIRPDDTRTANNLRLIEEKR